MSTTHSFEPAVPVHTYQRIVDQIEQAIVSGDIPVGSQLASERDLMVQFGVSRPTVREALRILQSMGLIESRPGTRGGPVVLAPSSKPLSRSLRALVGTDALDVSALVEYRVVLEGTTSRLAAVRHDDEQLARMRAAIEQMERDAEANADSFAAADIEFHEAIWEASGNEVLRLTGEAVSGVLRAIIRRDVENEHHDNRLKLESAEIDRSLFVAIEQRDGALASRIARRAVADRFGLLVESDLDRRALAALAE
ncbi:FadR/GntR family transcriptional regulator [Leucobacter chromiiresistens]|uniref:DNA-binding transcriptional regulator, FadR family n=1 Tax=Leucobacter chromiiresistens TaxID=1079994 RepID=A0A1H0Z716_9MICO|nr:FadR/GntR family transcriptional regulator [Leucobacter chromiiresistens]SDQ23267.1 DNA-binding transcriptional regulator, FadR family [Leucobacter chromiiresistens]